MRQKSSTATVLINGGNGVTARRLPSQVKRQYDFIKFLVKNFFRLEAERLTKGVKLQQTFISQSFQLKFDILICYLSWFLYFAQFDVILLAILSILLQEEINKRLSLPADLKLPENFVEKQAVSPTLEGPLSRATRRQSLSEIGFGRMDTYTKLDKLGEVGSMKPNILIKAVLQHLRNPFYFETFFVLML